MKAQAVQDEGRAEIGISPPAWLDPELHWALRFWEEARGPGRLPFKRHIDPLRMPPRFWPLAFLLQLRDDEWYARLMGTGYFDLYGVDVSGQKVSEFIRDVGAGPRALADFRTAQVECLPVSSQALLNWRPTRAQLRYQRVLMPFAADGGDSVQYLLGAMKLLDVC